jgi:hypothetical protein
LRKPTSLKINIKKKKQFKKKQNYLDLLILQLERRDKNIFKIIQISVSVSVIGFLDLVKVLPTERVI